MQDSPQVNVTSDSVTAESRAEVVEAQCAEFVGMSDDDEPMAVYRGVAL